jgi:protein transport protein SEC31
MSWGSFGVDTGAYPLGILAGGLQGGVVSLWNPHEIVQSKGASAGLLYSSPIHGEGVNCVECHPTKANLLATAGADGEVNILNIENSSQPDLYKPSSAPSKHVGSEVLCVSWNRKVAHILCSASNTGQTVVWDLKRKAEVISFKDPANRQRCSSVAWHPEVPMQLLVAYDDDRNPSMQMWDLRNVQYPFKEITGHSKGILDVAWNAMDPNLLLSCGKDNRLLCWCLSSGIPEVFCEVTSQQQNFEISWAPHKPAMLSASSFNGVVSVHSMQQAQSKEVKYCPRWYKKPCGGSFGFGGKVMAFGAKPKAAEGEQPRPPSSWCQALVVPNDPELVPAADSYERWIAERKLREYCQERVNQTKQSADTHDGLMWNLMALQFEAEGRQSLPAMLGFDSKHILEEAERYLGHKPGSTLTEAPPKTPQVQPQQQATPAMAPQLDLAPVRELLRGAFRRNPAEREG